MLAQDQIHLMDFQDGIRQIDNENIDCCITDPPYLWNKSTGGLSTTSVITSKWNRGSGNLLAGGKTANINNLIKFEEWLPELFRVMKSPSHTYIFVNDKNLPDMLSLSAQVGFKLHNVLVWAKNNKTPNLWYMKNCEFVVFLRKGPAFRINDVSSSQLLEYKNIPGNKKLHPTQKPVDLLKHLLMNSTKPGDLIFDPFMGSGSTAVAAKESERHWIGFENDPKFHRIATERLILDQIPNRP